jgi:hypothetical protein
MEAYTLMVLPGEFALCRLEPGSSIPTWALDSCFYSITNTTDELSVLCEARVVPTGTVAEKGWALLKIAAILDLTLTGITATFSTALANAGINLCVLATYNTDYILVPAATLPMAIGALEKAGFVVKQ